MEKKIGIHFKACWNSWKSDNIENVQILWRTANYKKTSYKILNIRVLLKIGCPDTFKARLRPYRKKAIDQRKTPMVPFVGFLFGWNVVLTSATFFHYEERNKFIVALIILMYRCRTFIEIMNSHIVMVINEISIDKKLGFFFLLYHLPFTRIFLFTNNNRGKISFPFLGRMLLFKSS